MQNNIRELGGTVLSCMVFLLASFLIRNLLNWYRSRYVLLERERVCVCVPS